MLIYHQCGHNFIWNLNSLQEDGAGEGLILSPVNIKADTISTSIPADVRAKSWLDPQFYRPHDNKGALTTYPYFPRNVIEAFSTTEFKNSAEKIATECIRFQGDLGFRYVVIPTRYFQHFPDEHLDQLNSLFVEPFLQASSALHIKQPLLLTVIAKPHQIEPGLLRDELLSWATAQQEITGIYLIFDNSFPSKQIKDPHYLCSQMLFVRDLVASGLEVHIGYCGLEGLLLSVADPTSITMGSYENLRSFGTARLETRERSPRNSPRPRIYSGRLLQSIVDYALPAMRVLTPNWTQYFDDSPFKEYLLNPGSKLNFQRHEVYRHYFYLISEQIRAMPQTGQRANHLRSMIKQALNSACTTTQFYLQQQHVIIFQRSQRAIAD